MSVGDEIAVKKRTQIWTFYPIARRNRAMHNLFDILNLPTAFELSPKDLEQRYFAAQRQWHPDRFIGRPEEERAGAAQRSMLINDAYDTLKNPLHRARHLLELHGVFVDEESHAAVPPTLLMAMMELRERIHDAAADGMALRALTEEIKQQAADCRAALASAFRAVDYAAAGQEVLRLSYLGKAAEEAHMLLFRLRATQGDAHAH